MKNQEKQLLNKLNDMEKLAGVVRAPEKVEGVFHEAVSRKSNSNDRRRSKIVIRWVCSGLAALFFGVNTSGVFAESVYKIPLLGNIAKVFTIREYSFENESSKMDIEVAGVEMENNTAVVKKINGVIEEKVDHIVKEQKELDEEYLQAYLETGGKIEDLNKIETKVDYKTFYSDENMVSFSVIKTQTLAGAYDEKYYFNMDTNSGENIPLYDILKIDDEEIKNRIIGQMENLMKENDNPGFDIDAIKNMKLKDDRKYFVNKNREIVIVFDKYEVAPGYMGEQCFIIGELK